MALPRARLHRTSLWAEDLALLAQQPVPVRALEARVQAEAVAISVDLVVASKHLVRVFQHAASICWSPRTTHRAIAR